MIAFKISLLLCFLGQIIFWAGDSHSIHSIGVDDTHTHVQPSECNYPFPLAYHLTILLKARERQRVYMHVAENVQLYKMRSPRFGLFSKRHTTFSPSGI